MNLRIAKKIEWSRRRHRYTRRQREQAADRILRARNNRARTLKHPSIIKPNQGHKVPEGLTLKTLSEAEVLCKFQYREIWANCEALLALAEPIYQRNWRGIRYKVNSRYLHEDWEQRLTDIAHQRGRGPTYAENHSTVVLRMKNGKLLFVTFHDLTIMIGTTCRGTSYWFEKTRPSSWRPKHWQPEFEAYLR